MTFPVENSSFPRVICDAPHGVFFHEINVTPPRDKCDAPIYKERARACSSCSFIPVVTRP